MHCQGRIVCGSEGFLHRTAHIDLSDICVPRVVVDVELVAGLKQGFTVGIKIDADVFHLVRIGKIAAEDVCDREYAGLEAVGIFYGLGDGHAVVHSERTGERSAYLTVDGDGLHVAE